MTDGSLTWVKSSYSGSQGGNCLEAAADGVGRVLVRDTKDRGGAMLEFRASRWREFSASLRAETDRGLSNCHKMRKSPQGPPTWTCGDFLFATPRRPPAVPGVTGRGAAAVPSRT
jgi:Domain of unknown function (DUF397)